MVKFLGPTPPSEESREPILRAPPIVIAFIALWTLIHIGSQFLSEQQYAWLIMNFALVPRLAIEFDWTNAGLLDCLRALVPFVSYAFLHGDFMHLLFNSVWFLIFATAVTRRVGTARFLTLSLIATIAAVLTHLVFHWNSPEPVVGASGAVSGLMGAAFRFIFVDPNATVARPPGRLPLLSRPVLMASAVWIALNVVLGATGFTPEGFGAAIAWEAHIGGFLAGLLLFPFFDRQRRWIS